MISCINDDRDRNRYRLEHQVVKADGIGEWSRALEDSLVGTASQHLIVEAYDIQKEINGLYTKGCWQYEALEELKICLDTLRIPAEDLPQKSDLKRWFRLFSVLRNKTRGHGAVTVESASKAAPHLARSISLLAKEMELFRREMAYLHRNLSGKYRVSKISEDASSFDFLRAKADVSLQNGVYIFVGAPRCIPLIQSDSDLQDFYFANGGFDARKYELISYYSGDKVHGDSTAYLSVPGQLPASETGGKGELLPRGNTFSNAPDLTYDYVSRDELESLLFKQLMEDKRPIVTLVGRGGVGKTSLALRVLQRIYQEERYSAVVWFSARDVDLKGGGPKLVRPDVFSPKDMSGYYASLVLPPSRISEKNFSSQKYFEEQLEKSEIGPCLYVFDNFETTQSPIEMFNWLDAYIRGPNKILITTRMREFKGDYPIEVGGMDREQAMELIDRMISSLGLTDLVDRAYKEQIFEEAGGHPYVMKILVGEIAVSGQKGAIRKIVAGSDEVLTALFERTYASLTPCAQRAFMTLSSWNSAVPRIALEAVLIKSTGERQEVEKGIDMLIQYSVAECNGVDGQEFLVLPLAARVFGAKKLNISPLKTAIRGDSEILQLMGGSKSTGLANGTERKIEAFISNVLNSISNNKISDDFISVLEMMCRTYNDGWLVMARWYAEQWNLDGYERAREFLSRFLQEAPDSPRAGDAWRMMASVCRSLGDSLGEIHALIERCGLSDVPFFEISRTAHRLSQLLKDSAIARDIKDELASSILRIMVPRESEADANDLSRMAWLAIHVGDEALAKRFTRQGLNLDQDNEHCNKLRERLHI